MTVPSVDREIVLETRGLSIEFGDGVRAVDDVSFEVRAGDLFALVGESGCGKSTLAYSLVDLVPQPGRVTAGEVFVRGRRLGTMGKEELNAVRGAEIAIVSQSAMSGFNPVITIGRQVEHIAEAHPGVLEGRREVRRYFEGLLRRVHVAPEVVWDSYESRLSGGMKQRVAIAVALLLRPSILVLDEPTTALDALNQRAVIDSVRELHDSLGLTVLFVTHDLAVVAELASRVGVMYAGKLVEVGDVEETFAGTRRHPYVVGLMEAIPSVMGKDFRARPIPGRVPNLAHLPAGCRFSPRCPLAEAICHEEEPRLIGGEEGLEVACHLKNRTLLAAREGAV